MKRWFKRIFLFLCLVYLLPTALAVAVWSLHPQPANWRAATWTSAGVLPPALLSHEPSITIFSARTGGLKGALAVHSWIVIKKRGEGHYDRYDVVGWGQPVRKNAYAADAFWYSNLPVTVARISGERAERLIPDIEQAIATYPYDVRGSYRLWPGPNSNTFVATVLRRVPDMQTVLPSNATGRDFLANGQVLYLDSQNFDLKFSAYGVVGLSLGRLSGLELQFMGLVAGFDLARPGIKIPGWGTFHLDSLVL